MIYNLVQYLRVKFPNETIYSNIQHNIGSALIPDRRVLVRETGGSEEVPYRFSQPTVQILVRDTNEPAAKLLADQIFNELQNRFGLILPSITVGSTIYPAVETAQISALQKPYCLGADENGRIEFTTNFKIIFVEE